VGIREPLHAHRLRPRPDRLHRDRSSPRSDDLEPPAGTWGHPVHDGLPLRGGVVVRLHDGARELRPRLDPVLGEGVLPRDRHPPRRLGPVRPGIHRSRTLVASPHPGRALYSSDRRDRARLDPPGSRPALDGPTPVPFEGLVVIEYEYGIAFFLAMAYSYLLFVASIGLFIRHFMHVPALHRKRVGAIVVGALLPLVGNALFNLGFRPDPPINLTHLGFAISGFLFFWAFFQFGLMDLRSVARRSVARWTFSSPRIHRSSLRMATGSTTTRSCSRSMAKTGSTTSISPRCITRSSSRRSAGS